MDDPTTDSPSQQIQDMNESIRLLMAAIEKLDEKIQDSSTRFDDTVSSLTDEIVSLAEQVNLNTQELRAQDGGY
jgi:predicted  nucleic acid-binding Zn-ribbon protein